MSTFSAVSTPAMNMASGLLARIFCICGEAVVAPRVITSSATTWMPDFSRPALKNLPSSWPRSVLSVISATFFRFFERACARSVAIWIEPSGPVCQKYGLGSCVVRVSPEFIGVICGVFASMVTVCCCCVAGVSDMLRMNTAPWSISFLAIAAEMSGRDWSSSIISSIFLPRIPPRWLITCAPKIMPSVPGSEYGFETPTRSVTTPILMVSCANPLTETRANTNPSNAFMFLLLIDQALLIHPSYTKFDRLLQQLGLALVVMGGPFYDFEGFIAARGSVVDDPRMRLRHRVVGRILDRQQRHGHRRGASRAVGIRVVDRPLRQPGAQRGEAPDTDRPRIGRFRLAHEGPARLAVVRLDRRIHE